MTDEEVAALQDKLAEAEVEVERLQTTAADREARAAHLQETIAQARTELASRDAELVGLRDSLSTARSEAEELRGSLRSAAEKYRQAVLASRAEVPPDLVGGETVEEVDRQLEAALRMVAQLKSHLESQAQAQRVPAGAPSRRAPDTTALTPTEKISYGLAQRN